MALRVGKPPSAGAWFFFERAVQASSRDPERFDPADPAEKWRRIEAAQASLRFNVKYHLAVFGLWASFALIVNLIAFIVDAGWGHWLSRGFMAVVTIVALGFILRFQFWRMKKRARNAQSVEKLSPLVKQARRGTFNGLDADPHMKTYAEAFYRRQQVGLDLENALPFEVQIAHDVDIRPGKSSSLTRVRENELRAVKPVIFSGLDFSTPQARERNRFLGSLIEQAEKEKSLQVGEIISTRGGVVVADIKYWNGTLSVTQQGTFVDHNLGLKELSRHRSINALAEAARFVNDGDIAFVLVIVAGGNVDGGLIETTMKGHRVVVAEWTEAMGELIHLDAKKTVVPATAIAEILDRTPVADD
ncbi:hypothetical protein [Corynebacterium sp. Marseille-P3884]|uniref:hypothetical protein n=1 Tax=Corynebacterium sp. Marseille-P3884 TaxID=2495409 RepID=UPI001B32520D|nr:hypothetical protein [Corynebacterium sp. Marseille-P3884]MBP3947584.1 hypothetical protein [Corynebacterium sp. Marseille-P3884]